MERLDYVCLALVDPRGHVLMQERDEHAPLWPDLWSLPGGGLEDGETPGEAVVRELDEETGVRLGTGELDLLGEFALHTQERGTVRFACFAAPTLLGDDDVVCREGRQMVFLDPARWGDLALVPATEMAAGAVDDWIDRHRPTPPDDARRFAGVLLVDRAGRLLLQERDEHPRIDPERWGLPGGHLDPGERFAQGALRELEEETGVALDPPDARFFAEFAVDHRHAYGSWDRMQVFAAATALTDAEIDCREGRQIVFVDPDRAVRLPLSHAAADIVPRFLRSDLYAELRAAAP